MLCGPAFFLGDLDVSIFTIWMIQFLVLEVSSECFNSYCILQRNSYTNNADPDTPKQESWDIGTSWTAIYDDLHACNSYENLRQY